MHGMHHTLTNHEKQVVLNVYDMVWLNEYTAWAGVGVFHSGLVIDDTEYAYGGHEFESSGIFTVSPGTAPGCELRTSILLGATRLDNTEIRRLVDDMGREFLGSEYNLLSRNCNHFADAFARRLIGQGIPGWVNRLATIGTWFPCLLPASLVPPTPESAGVDGGFVAFAGEGRALRAGGSDAPAPSASGGAASSAADADERALMRERAAAAAAKRWGAS
ncbi:ethylene-responsive element-binding protein [Thecamonas trahens ATCC 50062]|uniref:Ethylene-responsive element-binding protein n=1 Tax=Thecamonas trahens ATCC 50062 TaxID=461836 RepID=A0A0L0D0Z6_THETB|nr:ethylene-responsive element-binding protein [Thecamonas trahens ATCC 50062]KNC45902.1 ethylene-responsive element-binding protein [Thecamonas trahens ATCC 50062]|eukprot:XP_013762890.1 ethylene-responsive element-binding protein [Thecamonas trahens ATCC 50062]